MDDSHRVFALDADFEDGVLTAGIFTVFPYVPSPVTLREGKKWLTVELPKPSIMSEAPITHSEIDLKVLDYGEIS